MTSMADPAPITPDEAAALDAGTASPEVASRALAHKAAAYRAANAPPPPAPGTPAAAASRLAELQGDPAWRSRLQQGAPRETELFHALNARIAEGDPIDAALAMGGDPAHVLSNTSVDGVPSSHMMAEAVPHLRSLGLPDDVIKEFLEGKRVPTPDQIRLLERFMKAFESDPEVVRRFLKGDAELRRLHTLASIGRIQARQAGAAI
jgi:hypothetical protein